ncbi:DNA-3-methyladenine glycosylase I [Kocuria marina]|uniref:DNA-3-methyladenine glycosylase I n=1 Tax=Kocuria marina TaxID=223184 RepID=UPI0022E5AFDC|nr:DNA-3-methyladenine glycosylase I [Kocuria marina]
MTTSSETTSADAQDTSHSTPHTAFRVVHCGDGLHRCPWAVSTPGALADHDHDWGTAPSSADEYFATLTLELVDSGLARWSQSARHGAWYLHMADLEPARVSLFDEDDVDDLLVNPELIRNRAKIEAVIHNAEVCQGWDVPRWLGILEEAGVPLPDDASEAAPVDALALADSTAESRKLSQVLRSHGIVLVGPVTAHRWLQRIGRAPGHLAGCFRADPGDHG